MFTLSLIVVRFATQINVAEFATIDVRGFPPVAGYCWVCVAGCWWVCVVYFYLFILYIIYKYLIIFLVIIDNKLGGRYYSTY